jgi:aminoglycoside phosphotransferase
MTEGSVRKGELLAFLPEELVGVVQNITPINEGLSGAGVYAVATSRGAYVLRLPPPELAGDEFAQQLRVMRRAAEAEIAPALVHVDEAARAVVSVRIQGMPISAALANPTDRPRVLGSVIEQLRRLHALDTTGITRQEPLPYAQKIWAAQRVRPGFPVWAGDLAHIFGAIAPVLAADPRLTLNHNDMNPGNVMWDGERAWLIDWEACGLGHPYFDLACLALFLRLDEATAFALAERHDGAPLTDASRASFRAMLKLSGLLCGLNILGAATDLSGGTVASIDEAPTLAACYEGMFSGRVPLQSQAGLLAFGQALLALGVTAPLSD